MFFFFLAGPSELCVCIVEMGRGACRSLQKAKCPSPTHPPGQMENPVWPQDDRGLSGGLDAAGAGGLCRLGEHRCSQWPRCPGHTKHSRSSRWPAKNS